jgi:hypothetical protein
MDMEVAYPCAPTGRRESFSHILDPIPNLCIKSRYNMKEDPDQLRNLWSDPGYAVHRTELTDRLYASLPEETTEKLPRKAPV